MQNTKITKEQAVKQFRREYASVIAKRDKHLTSQCWHEYVDYLYQNGRITSNQVHTWSNPFDPYK